MGKVRATNIFLDDESLEASNGSLGVQEVLGVKLKPAGGLTKDATGLSVSSIADPLPTEGLCFVWDAVDANLSSAIIYPVGSGVDSVPVAYDGNLVALSVRLSGLPTGGGAGCILVKPSIDGVPLASSTFDCSFDSASPTQQEDMTDYTKSEIFLSGGRLGLVISTTAGLTPVTLNLVAHLVIRAD